MGSGKDTAAQSIQVRHPGYYTVRKFATPLRHVFSIISGIDEKQTYSAHEKNARVDTLNYSHSQIVTAIEYVCSRQPEPLQFSATELSERATDFMNILRSDGEESTVGRQLQLLGTECFRDLIDQNVWVNCVYSQWLEDGSPPALFTDVRFQNEVATVHRLGGIVIHLHRKDATCASSRSRTHASEQSIQQYCDYHIDNDYNSTDDLYQAIEDLFDQ